MHRNILQNSKAVKKGTILFKMDMCEIIQGCGQEMSVIIGYDKNYNDDNSDEFVLSSPIGFSTTFP